MLIDTFLPEYQYHEKHRITVKRPPAEVYPHLLTADFGRSRIIRLLFTLRRLPAEMYSIAGFLKSGFMLLGEEPPTEMLLGSVLDPSVFKPVKVLPEYFAAYRHPGQVKIAFNFHIEKRDNGSILNTETRICCGGKAALRRFAPYWMVVRPFSGLTRRIMLRVIRDDAEAGSRS